MSSHKYRVWLMRQVGSDNRVEDGSIIDVLVVCSLCCQVGSDSLVGDGSTVAERVSVKHSVIGRHCTIGDKCRITNCVIMNYVTIKEGFVYLLFFFYSLVNIIKLIKCEDNNLQLHEKC